MNNKRECPKCNLTFLDNPVFCSQCGEKTQGTKEHELIVAFVESEQKFFYRQNTLLKQNLQKLHQIIKLYKKISKRNFQINGLTDCFCVWLKNKRVHPYIEGHGRMRFGLENNVVCYYDNCGNDPTPVTYKQFKANFKFLEKANKNLERYFRWLETETKELDYINTQDE